MHKIELTRNSNATGKLPSPVAVISIRSRSLSLNMSPLNAVPNSLAAPLANLLLDPDYFVGTGNTEAI